MKKSLYLNLLIFQIIAISLTSCVSQKEIGYFQTEKGQRDTIAVAEAYVPKIQSGDILNIPIGSLNPAASSFFNPFSTVPISNDNSNATPTGVPGTNTTSITATPSQPVSPGYLVDPTGNIVMPLIGLVKVAGLTTTQARDTIRQKLTKYLKEPTVNVRFLNYKISVMGEVGHPSVYVIPNEKVTLPEALSMAGDITIFGKRENVLVIRDVDGKKEFGRVNLTSREVFSSPYYYLHANDIIYVEPGKGRIAQTDRVYQILPVILSALSLLTIIVEYSHR